MSAAHIGQEGDANEILIAKVVPATTHAGFYAYVEANGKDRYIGGPHATRLSAEIEAHDWIVGELRRRARVAEERQRVLKLHAGEHPAITDEQIAAELGKAVRS